MSWTWRPPPRNEQQEWEHTMERDLRLPILDRPARTASDPVATGLVSRRYQLTTERGTSCAVHECARPADDTASQASAGARGPVSRFRPARSDRGEMGPVQQRARPGFGHPP